MVNSESRSSLQSNSHTALAMENVLKRINVVEKYKQNYQEDEDYHNQPHSPSHHQHNNFTSMSLVEFETLYGDEDVLNNMKQATNQLSEVYLDKGVSDARPQSAATDASHGSGVSWLLNLNENDHISTSLEALYHPESFSLSKNLKMPHQHLGGNNNNNKGGGGVMFEGGLSTVWSTDKFEGGEDQDPRQPTAGYASARSDINKIKKVKQHQAGSQQQHKQQAHPPGKGTNHASTSETKLDAYVRRQEAKMALARANSPYMDHKKGSSKGARKSANIRVSDSLESFKQIFAAATATAMASKGGLGLQDTLAAAISSSISHEAAHSKTFSVGPSSRSPFSTALLSTSGFFADFPDPETSVLLQPLLSQTQTQHVDSSKTLSRHAGLQAPTSPSTSSVLDRPSNRAASEGGWTGSLFADSRINTNSAIGMGGEVRLEFY